MRFCALGEETSLDNDKNVGFFPKVLVGPTLLLGLPAVAGSNIIHIEGEIRVFLFSFRRVDELT